MIALNIPEIRDFMNKLLIGNVFDHFLLREALIRTDVTWTLDGTLHSDFYSSDELEELGLSGYAFLPFERLRVRCFDLIRGKRTPEYFKFVFLLSPDNQARTLAQTQSRFSPEDITGMFLNIKFQHSRLIVTTGISYRIFSADKSLEQEWDQLVRRFFKNNSILFEEWSGE